MRPCAHSLENFSEAGISGWIPRQQESPPPPPGTEDSTASLRARRSQPYQRDRSYLRASRASTRRYHRQPGPGQAAPEPSRPLLVPEERAGLVAFPTLSSLGSTLRPHEAQLIFAPLVSKLRTNKIRETAELF